MTEREEAFIEQAKIIEEITSWRQHLVQENTKQNLYSHRDILRVTNDPTFELEMVNHKDSVYENMINLCDGLIEFCKNNPLSKANAKVTKILFNKRRFLRKEDLYLSTNLIRGLFYFLIIPFTFCLGIYKFLTIRDYGYGVIALAFLFFDIPAVAPFYICVLLTPIICSVIIGIHRTKCLFVSKEYRQAALEKEIYLKRIKKRRKRNQKT